MGVFFEPTPEAIRDGGQKWALIYVAIGVGCWVFGMLQVSKDEFFFLSQRPTIKHLLTLCSGLELRCHGAKSRRQN